MSGLPWLRSLVPISKITIAGRNEQTLSKSNAINLSTVRPNSMQYYGRPSYIKT
jgi:hypothetical protein